MKRSNIRIAIQKSGRLRDDSLTLFAARGLVCDRMSDRKIIVSSSDPDIEFLFVRLSDIPQYVQQGAADFGIVGENTLYENDFDIPTVETLGFGKCSLIIAVPDGSAIKDIAGLEGERIATSYSGSLRKVLRRENVNAAIVSVAGSVEAAPQLGLADAICDIMQTGDSLRANGLRKVATLLCSQAILIESPLAREQQSFFKERYGVGKNLSVDGSKS